MKEQVEQRRKGRYEDGQGEERQRSQKRGVVLHQVYADRHKNDEV